MKKIVSLLVALVFCASLSVSALAATNGQATEGQATEGQATEGQPNEGKPNPELVRKLDELMLNRITSKPMAIEAVATLKAVMADPYFRDMDLYTLGSKIEGLEKDFLSFFPELEATVTGPENFVVSGAAFAGYAAGGKVTITAAVATSDAPYALSIDMTIGGSAAQPQTPIFIKTNLPASMAKNVNDYNILINHIKSNGSSEKFFGVSWFNPQTNAIIGVEFFTTSFSTFEFSLEADPSGGNNGEPTTPPIVDPPVVDPPVVKPPVDKPSEGGTTNGGGTSTNGGDPVTPAKNAPAADPIKATSSDIATVNIVFVLVGMSALLGVAYVASKKKVSSK